MMWLYIIIGVLLVAAVVWFIRHQRSLRMRAYLMEEAMRNHDFTFRLPTNGMLPGERAMQETLNHLGETIRQQISQNEVESWERLTRVLTHEIMNATAPIASISQSMLGRDDVCMVEQLVKNLVSMIYLFKIYFLSVCPPWEYG